MPHPTPQILMVEDNAADVAFVRRALKMYGLEADISVVEDAERALDYLDGCADDQCPDVVMIDVNLPQGSGMDVLKKCRFSPSLALTKTMVYTASRDPNDHLRADVLGADGYVRKPTAMSEFAGVVESLRRLLAPPRAA